MDQSAFSEVGAAWNAAYWAGAAALAAWILGLLTLGLNAGGLFLIWRQLRTGAESLEHSAEATRMAIMANRPWLSIDLGWIQTLSGSPDQSAKIVTLVRIRNRGASPAIDVAMSLRRIPSVGELDILVGLNTPPNTTSVLRPVFPGDEIRNQLVSEGQPGLPDFNLLIGSTYLLLVTYRMAGSTEVFRTPKVFFCRGPGPGTAIVVGDVLEFGDWETEVALPT
jgi:hypothetical protein